MPRSMVTLDANEAAAYIAHQLSEVIAIYPITPSSAMGEWADQWSAEGKKNIWGTTPLVVEMQSEAGAAGTVHGALQTGSLTTTFTASQGLMLMLPNMYKIAGELTSTVFHVSARSLAAQGLSIFGDHQDVMAARTTGWALLCSNSVQQVMDLALIAHAATLKARVPMLHFFDGFRTSHEVMKIEQLDASDLRALIDDELVRAHRARALSPDNPFIRGTAQNPDVYFQARETVNPFYARMPQIVQETMDEFAARVGRQYHLFDYVGAPNAERVIVLMGSGAEVAQEAIEYMNARGENVGIVQVHLYRPFSVEHFIQALPASVKKIAVLDRTKEPGATGEPLYMDVVTALMEGWTTNDERRMTDDDSNLSTIHRLPSVIGGRYGLSSKEFTPAMVKGVFDELRRGDLDGRPPKNHFTIGINDDVMNTSLDYDANFSTEDPSTIRALFYGLGADGTVGANKNSIKIIGDETDLYAQGYFVYDSKKSGSTTISHLRFGPKPIHSSYLIRSANFVACHQFSFLERFDMLSAAADGAVFLLNSPFAPDAVWEHLPRSVQETILKKHLQLYVIDAYKVARENGMGARINTVMQTCFFAISGVLPRAEAIAAIKHAIEKTYGKRGEAVVQKNFAAVDSTLQHLARVEIPERVTSEFDLRPPVAAGAPSFVQSVTAEMIAGRGDELPVSALPIDGTYPSGTAKWEKRNIALEIPVWDENICIQCGKCVFVCPHAVIRAKVYDEKFLQGAPENFKSVPARWKDFEGMKYTLQVSPEDCTGCTLCVEVCPVKNKSETRLKAINMAPLLRDSSGQEAELREQENANWNFFETLPNTDREKLSTHLVKDNQLLEPLFEFSGACAGCGETPYLKLITQLFGDRAYVANATGCSSIYGGNLPTTPWAFNDAGRGPAWANSLFEDNAEFGLGFRLTLDKRLEFARELIQQFTPVVGQELVDGILNASQTNETEILKQRGRVQALKEKLEALITESPNHQMAELARHLLSIADVFVKKTVWIVGGDGWAYDIGYGGLDHVLASGRNVNVVVLDTEVYSNTGGQMSKSTPRGAVAKFAAGGKPTAKKDLAMLAITYGSIYVARVAFGANDSQTVKAFLEAEAYDGPSLILAYSHCIAHGYDLAHGLDQQKAAVASGYWPLFRYDPRLVQENKNPLQLDSKAPSLPLEKYVYNETRYTMLKASNEAAAEKLLQLEKQDVAQRWKLYEQLAHANGKDTK